MQSLGRGTEQRQMAHPSKIQIGSSAQLHTQRLSQPARYTAMLSVLALEYGGITPWRGNILITCANGGVGSIAIAILSGLGYVSRQPGVRGSRLSAELGAAEVIDRHTLSEPGAPLAAVKWAGAIDPLASCAGERVCPHQVSRRSHRLRVAKAWISQDRCCVSSCAMSRSPASTPSSAAGGARRGLVAFGPRSQPEH